MNTRTRLPVVDEGGAATGRVRRRAPWAAAWCRHGSGGEVLARVAEVRDADEIVIGSRAVTASCVPPSAASPTSCSSAPIGR